MRKFICFHSRKLMEMTFINFINYFDHYDNSWFSVTLIVGSFCADTLFLPLQWHHNGHNSVSNHQPHDCLLNRLFRCRSKKTSKLRVTGLCAGKSPGPVNSPHKWPVTRKMFPFDDFIMTLSFLSDTISAWSEVVRDSADFNNYLRIFFGQQQSGITRRRSDVIKKKMWRGLTNHRYSSCGPRSATIILKSMYRWQGRHGLFNAVLWYIRWQWSNLGNMLIPIRRQQGRCLILHKTWEKKFATWYVTLPNCYSVTSSMGKSLYILCPIRYGKGFNYTDVIMRSMAYQITSLRIVYSTVYSGADQNKHQSSASLAFVRGIHWWPVNSCTKSR